jgi:hypothetical protein
MGCKADFAANSRLLARNSTQQTAQVRLMARRKGLVQRFQNAGVAQSVEQLIRNEKVGCSIHLSGTK